MPVTPLPIANGMYRTGSLPVSAQEAVNVFPEIQQAPAAAQETLLGTPGLYRVATSGDSVLDANRGAHSLNGRPYFVNGSNLFRLNADFTLDNLGTISGVGRVSMADNGTQLMILVPRGAGYIFTADPDTLTEITDSDFTANGLPLAVVFIDSYFVCATDLSGGFIVSANNDGLAWNALDFGSAESSPDPSVIPVVFKNQLFICGSLTIEAFNNVGGVEFPFQRTGLFLSQGVLAPFSVVVAQNTWMWVGAGENEGTGVWAFTGSDAQKVSTNAIDELLQGLSGDDIATIYAWSYGQAGHYFVGFTLPDTTIIYDTTTQRWHERKSRVRNADSTYSTLPWRVSDIVSADGLIFCGDTLDGRIGVIDIDTYNEYDSAIIRTFATQPFQNNQQPFFVPSLELTLESGVGNADCEDPVIRLQVSRDGGRTWSDERPRRMGKVGEYSRRAIWRRNGRSARFDVYRFICSDPVKFVGIQLTAQMEGMDDAA